MTAAAAISGGIVRIGDCGAAFGGAQFDGAPGDSGPDARASGDRAPGDEDGGRGSRDVSRHAHGGICLLIVGHCLLAGPARDAALAAAVRAGDLGRVAAWPGAYSAIVLSQGTATV